MARRSDRGIVAPAEIGDGTAMAETGEAHPPNTARQPVSNWPIAPRPTFGSVVLAHRWLILFMTILLTVAGVVGGATLPPRYTTTAQLLAGQTDVQSQAIPGYVQAAENLAEAYSRIVPSDVIIRPVAERVGRSPADVRASLTATPIPESTVIDIRAEGDTAKEAQDLARAATIELRQYSVEQTSTTSPAAQALADYNRAVARVNRLQNRIDEIEADILLASSDRAKALRDKLTRLRDKIDVAALEKTTLGGIYAGLRQRGDQTAALEVLQTTSGASSNRGSWMQRLGFLGFAVGLLSSLAYATASGNRRWRAARPAPESRHIIPW